MPDSKRTALLEAAQDCLGTPFQHQGRLPATGLDCAGLLVVAARAAGLSHYDFPYYAVTPPDGLLEQHLRAAGLTEIVLDNARPGDLLVLNFGRRRQHLALMTAAGILHADRHLGKVVEHRLAPHWRARLAAAYTFPGID